MPSSLVPLIRFPETGIKPCRTCYTDNSKKVAYLTSSAANEFAIKMAYVKLLGDNLFKAAILPLNHVKGDLACILVVRSDGRRNILP